MKSARLFRNPNRFGCTDNAQRLWKKQNPFLTCLDRRFSIEINTHGPYSRPHGWIVPVASAIKIFITWTPRAESRSSLPCTQVNGKAPVHLHECSVGHPYGSIKNTIETFDSNTAPIHGVTLHLSQDGSSLAEKEYEPVATLQACPLSLLVSLPSLSQVSWVTLSLLLVKFFHKKAPPAKEKMAPLSQTWNFGGEILPLLKCSFEWHS